MPSGLDEILRAQQAQQRRRVHLSYRVQLLAFASSAFVFAICVVGVSHHFFTFAALELEHRNFAFTLIAAPLAFLAGLLQFNIRSTALIVGCSLLGASGALVIAYSRFRGWAVIYDLTSGDFQNAFFQYPNIFLNLIFAVLFSIVAWWIGSLVMDYLKPII